MGQSIHRSKNTRKQVSFYNLKHNIEKTPIAVYKIVGDQEANFNKLLVFEDDIP
jgi:hypothetical protein